MIEVFALLTAAHLVADFPLQPQWLLARKKELPVLAGHGILVGLTAAVFLGALPWPLLALLVTTHIAMDAVKLYLMPDTLWAFLFDQLVHLLVIVGLAVIFPDAWHGGWWQLLAPQQFTLALATITLGSGLIATLLPGAIIIQKATANFSREIAASPQGRGIEGLADGGRYIGYLERLLVMLLILAGQPAGVGFLITAKSILRFGDVKESTQRKMTEYIIIGTFMSFGWGLLVALITQWGLTYLLAD